MAELSGRLALVTGGGSGIGREVCLLLAKDGARVIICDLNLAAAKETLKHMEDPVKHIAKSVDVACSKSVTKLFAEVELEIGCPDILVNCAGIKQDYTLVEMPEDAFDKVIAVNLKGTFLMTQAAAKCMLRYKVPKGSIVNISSISAVQGFHSNYSPSKAGVDSLTKNTARELGPHNIRCNSVRPGIFRTPLNDDISSEQFEAFMKEMPLQRIGEPKEVAEVVRFLASDRSSFITGDIIQVSGGWYM